MTDEDPWQHTKDLLGDDFFDVFEPDEEEVRRAFEAELRGQSRRGAAVLGARVPGRGARVGPGGDRTGRVHRAQEPARQ